jgi:hypothetical protein
MVGDHHGHGHVEFAAAVAPQQVQYAVELAGDPGGEGALKIVRAAGRPGRWNSVRWKNVPPLSAVVCWARVTMLAPALARKALMADTMPG